MHLDKQHPVPVYRQLKEMLQSQIEDGVYYSHQKLPSERDLCQSYDLSRMTARRALQVLIEEGLAYTRIGKGTFVSEISRVSANGVKGSEPASSSNGEHCRTKLIEQLINFDTTGVELTINKMLATHSLEVVAVKLFPQVIRELDRLWHSREINLLTQNYALTTLRGHLAGLINSVGQSKVGPKVLLACAPEDQHELGLLLLSLVLRRRGFTVIYLGPNISPAEFHQVVEAVQPALLCLSAATERAAQNLALLSQEFVRNGSGNGQNGAKVAGNVVFSFAGVAFAQRRSLVSTVAGLYLGDSIDSAVAKIEEALQF